MIGLFFVRTQRNNKSLVRLICRLSHQSKMQINTYILQSYKSGSDWLKSTYLDYTAKIGCKYSTMFNIVLQYKKVLQYNKVPVCKFATQPKNCTGLRPVERFRVKTGRTTGVHADRTV